MTIWIAKHRRATSGINADDLCAELPQRLQYGSDAAYPDPQPHATAGLVSEWVEFDDDSSHLAGVVPGTTAMLFRHQSKADSFIEGP